VTFRRQPRRWLIILSDHYCLPVQRSFDQVAQMNLGLIETGLLNHFSPSLAHQADIPVQPGASCKVTSV
jgi:hypothetical protein